MPAPKSYTTDDLEFFFYGGGNDAEYEFLKECYAAGITAADIIGFVAAPPGSTTDHGSMLGLGDDDHPQYLNNARGDARYDARYLPIGTAYETPTGAQAKADAKVENQIIPGVTTKAPSQEAVNSVLLTKASVAALNAKADIDSPAFTNNPTAPTQIPGTNNTRLATTAFATAADAVLKGAPPATLNTLEKIATSINNDPAFYTTLQALLAAKVVDSVRDGQTTTAPSENAVFDALALKANLISPAFSGSPTVPIDAYNPATWLDGVIPSRVAIRNKFESLPTHIGGLLSARPAAGSMIEGSTYFATDVNNGTLYRIVSSAWMQAARGFTETVPTASLAAAAQIPHSDFQGFIAGAGSTSSTTYVDLPVHIELLNFVKARADTKLVVRYQGLIYIDDAGGVVDITCDVGGLKTPAGGVSALAANTTLQVAAERELTIGALSGTFPVIKLQWRVGAATTVATMGAKWQISVTETF